MPAEGDAKAKARFIDAFFEDFRDRVRFARTLLDSGREIEAMILACAYIEGIANNSFPECSDSSRNFVRVLVEHGNIEMITLIHPRWLRDALPRRTSVQKALAAELPIILPPTSANLLTRGDLLEVAASLPEKQKQVLAEECWRGTLANIVYVRIRSEAIKKGLGSPSISFSEARYKDMPIASLDIELLLDALTNVLEWARELSLATNKWFGTDLSK